MKFKDPITGEYKTLYLKTGDTLPVGTIVSFDGDEIPEGYEEVIGEEARVVISPTEPTTGEEVWIQRSNNLFDINGVYEKITGTPTINDDSITLPSSSGNAGSTKFLNKIEISGPITISFDVSNSDGYARPLLIPLDNNGSVVTDLTIEGYTYLDIYKGYYRDYANGNYELVLNFPENVKYFQLGFVHIVATFSNIQIEKGATATTYEPYVDKKIYTKNNNNEYDTFYDETNREIYSTSEQRIGTWIDGKPIYRKVLTANMKCNGALNHGINDIETPTNIRVLFTQESNNWTFLPKNGVLPEYTIGIDKITNTLIQLTCGDYFDNDRTYDFVFILEYTKTTD